MWFYIINNPSQLELQLDIGCTSRKTDALTFLRKGETNHSVISSFLEVKELLLKESTLMETLTPHFFVVELKRWEMSHSGTRAQWQRGSQHCTNGKHQRTVTSGSYVIKERTWERTEFSKACCMMPLLQRVWEASLKQGEILWAQGWIFSQFPMNLHHCGTFTTTLWETVIFILSL